MEDPYFGRKGWTREYSESTKTYGYIVIVLGIAIIGLITYKKVTLRKKTVSRMKKGGEES